MPPQQADGLLDLFDDGFDLGAHCLLSAVVRRKWRRVRNQSPSAAG
jgi:hypothetical protein